MILDISDADVKTLIQALFVAANSGHMEKDNLYRIQQNLKETLPEEQTDVKANG